MILLNKVDRLLKFNDLFSQALLDHTILIFLFFIHQLQKFQLIFHNALGQSLPFENLCLVLVGLLLRFRAVGARTQRVLFILQAKIGHVMATVIISLIVSVRRFLLLLKKNGRLLHHGKRLLASVNFGTLRLLYSESRLINFVCNLNILDINRLDHLTGSLFLRFLVDWDQVLDFLKGQYFVVEVIEFIDHDLV